MTYTLTRTIAGASLNDADLRVRKALADQGFGVLTEIDVQATMKAKLNEEMPGYRILGACNPRMAFDAIAIEPRIGAMLPCNVILRETGNGVEISSIDPVVSMESVANPKLLALAGRVRTLLQAAIDAA